MKKLLWLGVIALLFSCKPTDVTVILTVDTQKLYAADPTSQAEKLKYMTLTDDHKGRLPCKGIEFYKSKVFKEHKVTWVGVSKSPDYTVAIDKIEMVHPSAKNPDKPKKRYANFFDSEEIIGRGGKHGIAVGKIKSDLESLKYFYTLYFTIHEDGGAGTKSFEIDPQLKAHH